jgi:hypothetical protein
VATWIVLGSSGPGAEGTAHPKSFSVWVAQAGLQQDGRHVLETYTQEKLGRHPRAVPFVYDIEQVRLK